MIHDEKEGIPVHYWNLRDNFGDLLAPWLVERMTGRPVVFIEDRRTKPHYMIIGSILGHVRSRSTVWGIGSFGLEEERSISVDATYLAVRGPLTRNKILCAGGYCPEIYGDPALLVPYFYAPKVQTEHKVGVVLRHSEGKWRKALNRAGIKVIDFHTRAIERTIREMLSCELIVSTSLHGLIVADAYGIPNAWVSSTSPTGGQFKYWDYLIAVEKVRRPSNCDLGSSGITAEALVSGLEFDAREPSIDMGALISANPFGWAPTNKQ